MTILSVRPFSEIQGIEIMGFSVWHWTCSLGVLIGGIIMKQFTFQIVSFSTGICLGLIFALLAYWGISVSLAATFQNIFNNVEQGANSTASPQLHVVSGKPEATPIPVPDAVTEPQVQTTQTLTPLTTVSTEIKPEPKEKEIGDYKFRAGLHYIALSRQNIQGAMGAIGFFPLRQLGVSLFGGGGSDRFHLYGAELEVIPLRLSILGAEDALEAAAVVGGFQTQDTFHAHAGGKLTANFGERFGLTAGLRTPLTNQGVERDWISDIGLVVRF